MPGRGGRRTLALPNPLGDPCLRRGLVEGGGGACFTLLRPARGPPESAIPDERSQPSTRLGRLGAQNHRAHGRSQCGRSLSRTTGRGRTSGWLAADHESFPGSARKQLQGARSVVGGLGTAAARRVDPRAHRTTTRPCTEPVAGAAVSGDLHRRDRRHPPARACGTSSGR